MQLSSDQFIDFAILIGNDYNGNPPNVGPVTAYKLIKDHGCLENIIECDKKFNWSEISETYEVVRSIFKSNGNEDETFISNKADFKALDSYLVERKFSAKNIAKYMEVLEKYEKNKYQSV